MAVFITPVLRKKMSGRMKHDIPYAILFLAPSLLGLTVFTLIPILASLGLAFTDWTLLSPPEFVGLKNFRDLFADELLWGSLWNTLKYAAMIVPGSTAIALALALFINREFRRQIFRLFYAPLCASLLSIAMVWRWPLNTVWFDHKASAVGLPAAGCPEQWVLPAIVII